MQNPGIYRVTCQAFNVRRMSFNCGPGTQCGEILNSSDNKSKRRSGDDARNVCEHARTRDPLRSAPQQVHMVAGVTVSHVIRTLVPALLCSCACVHHARLTHRVLAPSRCLRRDTAPVRQRAGSAVWPSSEACRRRRCTHLHADSDSSRQSRSGAPSKM